MYLPQDWTMYRGADWRSLFAGWEFLECQANEEGDDGFA
jgi:hypothetical protein